MFSHFISFAHAHTTHLFVPLVDLVCWEFIFRVLTPSGWTCMQKIIQLIATVSYAAVIKRSSIPAAQLLSEMAKWQCVTGTSMESWIDTSREKSHGPKRHISK